MKSWMVAAIGVAMLLLGQPGATAAEKKAFTAKVDADGIQRVEILGGSYFFDPNYVIVKKNVPAELSIRKERGMTPHDVVLKAPEAGIDFALELKDTLQTVRFTPTKAGVYPFTCEKKLLFFESHKEKGMTGTLEVQE
ncbi:MAG: cupredoxin domain-containing protein [Deltaproteobacteria bacterium]|nr:cupredoxin domain-containing protein [Deltaproteobacteria bacterium]